jgi:hypothetical protein
MRNLCLLDPIAQSIIREATLSLNNSRLYMCGRKKAFIGLQVSRNCDSVA